MPLRNNKNLHPMDYQTQSPQEIEFMKALNKPLKDFYDLVEETLPESDDKTVTLRKIAETRMQLNATIVLNGVKV